jgi:hypothetical protein
MTEEAELISDELLYAFVDGEVDSATRSRVEAALAHDPQLAARVARHRAFRTRIQAAFESVASEPVPDRLLKVVPAPAPAPVADLAAAREKRASTSTARSWSWREWSAMAATLVLGILISVAFRGGSASLPLAARNGEMIATGELRTALTEQLSQAGAAGASVQINLSIRTAEGGVCRSFALSAGQAGLACRKADNWVIEVMSASPVTQAGDNYRQAGSTMPEAVRRAIEARATGEPLTLAEETRSRQSGWSSHTPQ